ncbi:MAG: C25 family cysteine peptidase [Chloroflexota bacterium]
MTTNNETSNYPSQLRPIEKNDPWTRPYLLAILKAALKSQSYQFVRQTALAWLAAYDGDAEVYLLRARALLGDKRVRSALSILEHICQADPEFLEAQKLRAEIANSLDGKAVNTYQEQVYALDSELPHQGEKSATWSELLKSARSALVEGDFEEAQNQAQSALASAPDSCLVALTHLQALWRHTQTPKAAIRSLAKHYQEKWPDSIAIMLITADSLMDGGQSDEAVALLHKAASLDIAGKVAARLWGNDHPYRALWPNNPATRLDIAIPAEVAAVLGWNLLSEGEYQTTINTESELDLADGLDLSSQSSNLPKSSWETENASKPKHILPETLQIVQDELDRIAKRLKKTGLSHSDGRLPIYVIMSTREGLRQKYGTETTAVLDEAMRKLALALRSDPNWGSMLIYADDPANMAKFNLKPAQAKDAWALKLALADLDTSLRKRGAMIGALLIVGGPEVVPFHHLPNPTDDHDVDVPSDNPYATRNENYFVPEWPVGRLPGGAGKDPGMLLSTLRSMTSRYEQNLNQENRSWLLILLKKIFGRFIPRRRTHQSFGYSAEIWKQAAIDVFRPIGEMRNIDISPPTVSETTKALTGAQLGYYNLHGIEDGAFWYGHKAPTNDNSGPDYPIALRPEDIPLASKSSAITANNNGAKVPSVVFSEACYGTHVKHRNIEESIALKFLLAGTQAVIGSTVTAYGSISTPLIAADILGHAFWQRLQEGFPVGEALRRAKIYLAQEMHKRQGYLDGEDQKTLISFVLYGDPLAQPIAVNKLPKTVMRTVQQPSPVKTICDRADTPGTSEPVPTEIIAHVKNVVEQYLPGMKGAQVMFSHEHSVCDCEGHNCPTGQLGEKSRPTHEPDRSVITLSKSIQKAQHTHQRYARLTLDKQGKIVKMAVSR